MNVGQPSRDTLLSRLKWFYFFRIFAVMVLYLSLSALLAIILEHYNLQNFIRDRAFNSLVLFAILGSGLLIGIQRNFLSNTDGIGRIGQPGWINLIGESVVYTIPLVMLTLLFKWDVHFNLLVGVFLLLFLPVFLKAYDVTFSKFVTSIVSNCGENLLVVGTGPKAKVFIRSFANSCPLYVNHLKVIDDEWVKDNKDNNEPEHLNGFIEDIADILSREAIDKVYIFLPFRTQYDKIVSVINECVKQGVPVVIHPIIDLPGNERVFVGPVESKSESLSMQGIYPGSPSLYTFKYRVIKRIIDIVLGSLLVVVTSPLMVTAALLIKISSPGPVIFKQERWGFRKKRFKIYKFRTMYVDAEERLKELLDKSETGGAAFKMKNDPRITPVGRILRRFSIDELPQLFNVLKGDMSLVGPRPLPLSDYERFYNYAHLIRMAVVPGVTGLWQVCGRSDVPFEEWMEMDRFYINNWSLKLDFLILLKTIKAVFTGHGAV